VSGELQAAVALPTGKTVFCTNWTTPQSPSKCDVKKSPFQKPNPGCSGSSQSLLLTELSRLTRWWWRRRWWWWWYKRNQNCKNN